MRELPPRARRIREHTAAGERHVGTTSACAENTGIEAMGAALDRNYLRVRGEYQETRECCQDPWELPPRARRIHDFVQACGDTVGTTSACAENTEKYSSPSGETRNYLRVRGEYWAHAEKLYASVELPPRARRILLRISASAYPVGTTSACAENTLNELGLL